MKSTSNSEINPNILEKVRNSDAPENVKEFLFDILELEYEKLDENNARLKDAYIKRINEYKKSD